MTRHPPAAPAGSAAEVTSRSANALAAVIALDTLTPAWAAVAERFGDAGKVTDRIQELTRGERPLSDVHDLVAPALLRMAQIHATGCTAEDCLPCRTFTDTVSWVLAENEVREGRA